jgi:hypothetical protein
LLSEVGEMAIVVMVEVPGGTQAQYDRVAEAMGVAGASQPPPGQIVHLASPSEGGWTVIDVWESRDAYERHLAAMGEKGREAVRRAGLPAYIHREFEAYKVLR